MTSSGRTRPRCVSSRFLVPRLDDLPVVLAVAARPAEGDAELFPQLVADSAGSVIRPHELSKEAVAELVREGVSADAMHEALGAALREKRVPGPRVAGAASRVA